MNAMFVFCTVSNVKFFVKDFFSKCELLRICSHVVSTCWKSLTKNSFFMLVSYLLTLYGCWSTHNYLAKQTLMIASEKCFKKIPALRTMKSSPMNNLLP